jgi:hypothetical protein
MTIKSFRGSLEDATETTISLHTIKGKTGYKIVKFQIYPVKPGVGVQESVVNVWKEYRFTPGSGPTTVDFDDQRLLATAFLQANAAADSGGPNAIQVVFDNEIINQDITVQHEDLSTGEACNFYLELELIKLSDVEAEITTIKDLRNSTIVTS